jgi:Mrp family chromosome partitioning ATPase
MYITGVHITGFPLQRCFHARCSPGTMSSLRVGLLVTRTAMRGASCVKARSASAKGQTDAVRLLFATQCGGVRCKSGRAGDGDARVVCITSGKGGVGKTTTTASFGMGLALKGYKTAVVDFDLGLRNCKSPHEHGCGRSNGVATSRMTVGVAGPSEHS